MKRRDATHRLLSLLQWFTIGVAGLWSAMSFTYPFGWDQGIFAWVGGVINAGGMPYRDAWDIKGPLVYYVYAFVQAVFGVHLWSIRVVDLALLLVASASVYKVAKDLTDRSLGRWAAIVFFLWYASHSYWHTAQPDGWVGMFLVIALAPVITGKRTATLTGLVPVGLCIGLATLFKPFYAGLLLVPILYVAWTPELRRRSRYFEIVASWSLPIVVIIVWFMATDTLGELFAIHIQYPALTYANAGTLALQDRLQGIVEYLLTGRVIAVILPLVVYGAFVLWKDRRRVALMLIAWAVFAILVVALQNRFFAYHWLPILPPAVLLGIVGFQRVWTHLRPLAVVFLLAIMIHCLTPILLEEFRFAAWVGGRIDTETYYDGYGEQGDEMKLVRWLREQGRDGDVFIFGWNATVGWLSERQSVSRFGFSMPLLMGDGLDFRSDYRLEALAALRETPPQYIVVGTQSEEILGEQLTIDDFSELAELVRGTYREVVRFGELVVHERSFETLPL